jgi:DNA helicase-2/ATP-dependent DNA helicase PcrA
MMEQIALMADQDTLAHDTPQSASPERASQTAPLHRGAKENPSRVKLMTIHAAKGLEFDHIFICGLEQGLFPSDIGDTDNTRDDEEERRLMYVALTRAKKQLFLSYAQTRTIYGRTTFQTPSEFLDDIPQDHIILEGGANPFGGSPDDVVTEYLDW